MYPLFVELLTKEYKEELEKILVQIDELEEIKENKQLEKRLHILEEDKNQLEKRLEKSEKDKNQLEKRLHILEEDKNQLEKRLEKSEEDKNQLEKRLEKSEKDKKQLEKKLEKSEEKSIKLEEEVNQVKKYIIALKEKTTDLKYVKLKDYEEEGFFGEDTSSSVKIVHKKEQEKYVKKELTEITYDSLEQFVHEGEILNKLRHPCIIEIIGINLGNKKISPSLFLPFEPGSLEKLIENDELDEHQKNKIIVEIVLGMRFIHERNFIHRSLKPRNILLDKNKHVRISDFGLAKEESFETSRKKGFSTLRFLAPELFEDNEYDTEEIDDKSKSKSKKKIKDKDDDDDDEYDDKEEKNKVHYTNKVDVYSFGITLIFIITGSYPKFSMKNIMNGTNPSIPKSIVKWVRELISNCLSFSPKNRPSFAEIYETMKENNYDFFKEKSNTKLNRKQRSDKKEIETRILEIEAFEYQHLDE